MSYTNSGSSSIGHLGGGFSIKQIGLLHYFNILLPLSSFSPDNVYPEWGVKAQILVCAVSGDLGRMSVISYFTTSPGNSDPHTRLLQKLHKPLPSKIPTESSFLPPFQLYNSWKSAEMGESREHTQTQLSDCPIVNCSHSSQPRCFCPTDLRLWAGTTTFLFYITIEISVIYPGQYTKKKNLKVPLPLHPAGAWPSTQTEFSFSCQVILTLHPLKSFSWILH